MIPILYEGTEQNFITNGLGRLADAISCKVTEERNGQFELEMTYPITGVHYEDITESRIILAKTEEGGNNQAFMIYKISKPLNGIVTINAQHISYLLNGFVVMPFSAVSCADAFGKIAENIVISTPFSFFTDVQSTVSFHLDSPRAVRNLLGGEQGSLLDTYGGYDYKFDNFDVYLLQNRGRDNGVSIRYGKNLTDLKNSIDSTNVYTGIVPYWADNEGNAMYLPEKVVLSEHSTDYPYKIIKTVDFSSDFETKPSEAQLRARAQSYIASSTAWKLKNSIDVSFINLGQTDEYKHIAALERVKLCDYVTVVYSKLGVNIKTKVIKTVYNVLTEKYDTISLGDTTYTLAKAIQGALDSPSMTEVTDSIKSSVSRATKLIQGGLGGHVVFNTDGNGEPQEILIMDTDDIATAVNVIRMNLNGIGFSHNGYNGPFETAWTIDGHFVANFIDTGELDASIIKANTLNANALTVEAQSDIGALHDYLPYDINSNVDHWAWKSGLPKPYLETIDGKTYTAFDGSSIASYSSDYYASASSDFFGQPNIDVSFKIRFNKKYVVHGDRIFFLLFYYDVTENYWWSSRYWSEGRTFEANTDYDVSFQIHPYHNAFSFQRIEIVYQPDVIMYVRDLKVTSSSGEYQNASLRVSPNGLSSIVQKAGVISAINQSAESVSIEARKINLTGDLSLRGDFTSYAPNDDTTYAFLDSGCISFYNQNTLMFTIAATAWQGQYAGIYFGDPQDFAKYTHMNQDYIVTPTLYVRGDGSQYVPTGAGDALIEGDFSVYGSSIFYGNVYDANSSLVFVSDKRKKKNIKDLALNKARSFLMSLIPRMFKFKEGTSGRFHHGFIAQEVKKAMGDDDWGLYVEDAKSDFIGLRYDEIIADLVKVVQDQEKRIDALERKIK